METGKIFSVLWKARLKLIGTRAKWYVLMGNKEKERKEYEKILKMLDAYKDYSVDPVFKEAP